MANGSVSKQKRIFGETLKSARLGLAEAQYEVGLMYANGIGVAQNIEQAVHWVAQAAQRGLVTAQYLLGTRYASGIGVAQSEHLAVLWLAKAAEQGHVKAKFRLAKLYASAHATQAADLYRQAAEAGLADAQLALARAFESGTGVPQDSYAALEWTRLAAEQGLASAQFALAQRYAHGDGLPRDPEQALALYRKAAAQDHLAAQVAIERHEGGERQRAGRRRAGNERRRDTARWVAAAENGNADAKYHLGVMLEEGLGLPQDSEEAARWYLQAAQQNHVAAQLALARLREAAGLAEAVDWYERAAQSGDAEAQFALGRIYSAGEMVPQNFFRGVEWYLRAAQQGETRAMLTLGNLFHADMRHVAVECFAQAAELGVAQAQCLLARQYERGNGVGKNLATAFRWYEKAALQNLPEAMSAVGVAYLKGIGVARDFARAIHWLQKAADLGDARAQWNVGALYASGAEGVARDLKQAFAWCQRAAAQGFAPAQANLGALYALADNPAQAVVCWEKAAAQGDPEATYNLALACLKGVGTEKDAPRAFALLLQAANQGVAQAQARVALMYATADGAVQDPIEAHKWFVLAADGDESARANLARSAALLSAPMAAEGLRRAQEWRNTRIP